MADEQRLIYKVELDDSGYIRATEQMAASTAQLTQAQDQANKTLQANQTALRGVSANVQQTKKDLDAYTGSDEKHRQQLQKSYNDAVKQEQSLTVEVQKNQAAYESATKAATDFANTAAKASTVQQQAGGGRVAPTPTPLTPPPAVNLLQQFPDLADLPDIIASTTDEFEQLRIAIAASEEVMAGLNQESSEFKQLAPIVEQGKLVLQQYDAAAKSTADSHVTLRTQLRANREELVRLELAGKESTDRYRELEIQTARLTDKFNDQQQRIRILASDTKLLDFGKGAITAATAAFQGFTSVQLLFGQANEATQKKVVQLFAAMQLLQSLETLSNLTRREGVITTLAQSAAQGVYTAAVGASTGALRAFRIALLGTGIGVAVVVIGLLVKHFIDLKNAQEAASKQQQILNDVLKQSGSEYSNAVKNVEQLRINIDLAKQGFIDKKQVVAEYNKTIGETTGHVTSLDQAEQQLNKNADAYIRFTFLKAAANVALGEAAKKAFEVAEDERKKEDEFLTSFQKKTEVKNFTIFGITFGNEQSLKAEAAKNKQNAVNQGKEDQKTMEDIASDFQKQASELAKKYHFNFFQDQTKPDSKAVENVFIQERDKLLSDLAALRTKEADSIQSINDEFAAKLTAEQNRISALLKAKKITSGQEKTLIELAVQVNTAALNKALEDFNKKVTDAREKLNEQLRQLQEKANQDTLNLIQDEFERRKALIDANEQKELADQKAATQQRLDSLDLDRLLIGEQEYQKARQIIVATGEQEVNAIVARAAQQRQDLSVDIFKKSLDAYQQAVDDIGFIEDRRQSEQVQAEADRFLKGEIDYETFQRHLDDINKQHNAQRTQQDIDVLTKELDAINARLATLNVKLPTAQIAPRQGEQPTPQAPAPDTSKEEADLIERQKKVSEQLSNLRKQDSEADAKDRNELIQQRLKSANQYAEAIGSVADSVVRFWQTANEAEQKALDRSIALQQQRVDEAQKIADRGNASYLASETDRLKQLQVARENAARRQLAIDAALQASQILVGITGAIAKISTGIGVAETIAEIAVIVGALATGYGLVRSLQGNQPRLKEGTPYLQRGEHPRGTDTIPALLTEGEAVIPRERNQEYHPTVKAIYDQKIPAKVINEFVKNYTKKNVVSNVVNETSDNKIEDHVVNEVVNNEAKSTIEKVTDVVSKFSKQDKSEITKLLSSITNEQTSKIVSTLVKNKIISKEDKKSLSEQLNNVISSAKDYRFAEVVNMLVNKTINENTKRSFISEYGEKKYSQVVDSVRHHDVIVNSLINRRLNTISRDVKDAVTSIVSESVNRKIDEGIVNDVISKKTIADFVSVHTRQGKAKIEKILSDKSINVIDNLVRNKVIDASDISNIKSISDFQQTQRVFNILNKTSDVIDRTVKERVYMPKVKYVEAPLSPSYERIKEAAEMKITHDSKLASSLTEQNKLIEENNDLQRMTLKAMKNLSVTAKMDREGIAIAVNEHIEQMLKNKRV